MRETDQAKTTTPIQKSELVSNDDDDDDDNDDSSSEKCGFVCHVLCLIPLTFLYSVWIWVPDDVLHAADITYYPDKSWSVTIPVCAFGLFVAAPIMYSIINRLAVPRVDSIDTVHDDFTRLPPEATTRITTDNSSVPEIYDLDVGDVNDRVAARLRQSQQVKQD